MQFGPDSTLANYAKQFWERQATKATIDDKPALTDIANGGDPVGWLANIYPYKLPRPTNSRIRIATLEAPEDIGAVLIHEGMLKDEWTTTRCLTPCPKSRRIADMVTTALERKYFDTDRDDTQIKLFNHWKTKDTLTGFIDDNSLPLIELTWPNQFEIVDGWGRLHAFLALVRLGKPFSPVQAFIASPE